jgi:hypothetical protein
MDEEKPEQQSTSILELIYLIRAKNKGELSFAEWRRQALCWAQAVVTEYEGRQPDTGVVNEDNRSQ